MQQISFIPIYIKRSQSYKKKLEKAWKFSKEGVTLAQIILISAMRCNFNKEIRMEKMNVKPATGKLGVLCVGLGAVTSTFMTGVLMARKGLAKPVGSMTQYDKMRVGRGENKKYLHYGEIVPLANLNDIVFGAWDVYPANAYESAVNAEVLKEKDINPVKDELEKIVPMKAAFDHNYASRLDGDNVKDCKNRWDMMEQLREDIRNFKVANNCDRIVVLWAASTEIYVPVDEKNTRNIGGIGTGYEKMMIRLISLRLCAMLMLHCRKDVLSLWEHLIQLLIFLLCGSWLKRLKCLLPARISRRVKRWLNQVSHRLLEPVV